LVTPRFKRQVWRPYRESNPEILFREIAAETLTKTVNKGLNRFQQFKSRGASKQYFAVKSVGKCRQTFPALIFKTAARTAGVKDACELAR